MNSGERPQNYIKKYKPDERFEDYPKAKELIRLKTELINLRNHPPVYIKADLKNFDLANLGKVKSLSYSCSLMLFIWILRGMSTLRGTCRSICN